MNDPILCSYITFRYRTESPKKTIPIPISPKILIETLEKEEGGKELTEEAKISKKL